MCGICGCVGPGASEARVKFMLDRMAHRGPDGEGLWGDQSTQLGHRRLAIVDLSDAGRQPIVSEDGALIAVVNGEIYNYTELRHVLEQKGALFHSDCDSEVVVHAFRAWGTSAFERLNGMFAFALFDARERKLFLVRDRAGIKPLYYLDRANLFLFASEIKALLAGAPEHRWRIDPTGLGQYLTFENLLGEQSLFADVRSVRPAHFVMVQAAGCREYRYWEPEPEPEHDFTFNGAVERFRASFEKSVGRHLMSDVPVASYLSAGLDSTMVASQAARCLNAAPNTFTGRFTEGGWYDEMAGAQLVADRMGSTLRGVEIIGASFAARFDDVIHALDEPRMGFGAVPQFSVAREAARHHKVILTGHGGDELFCGYPVNKVALFVDALDQRKARALTELSTLRTSELPHLAYFALQRMRGGALRYFLPVLFSGSDREQALQPDVASAIQSAWSVEPLERIWSRPISVHERLLLTYLQIYLPGLLVVEDKISMAHSLESRTPMLDNEMLDLSLRMPGAIKLHQGRLKAVVRAAAREVLPPALFDMPKRGFPTPLAGWLRGPLASWMRQRICDPRGPLARIFRPEFLDRETAGYSESLKRMWRPLDEIPTHRIWMLLSLESWLRQHEERYGVTLEVA